MCRHERVTSSQGKLLVVKQSTSVSPSRLSTWVSLVDHRRMNHSLLKTSAIVSSMERFLRGWKGLFKSKRDTTSWQPTLTTKAPLRGFSGLIDTVASSLFAWTPRAIACAKRPNTPQDLQASIMTVLVPVEDLLVLGAASIGPSFFVTFLAAIGKKKNHAARMIQLQVLLSPVPS